MIRIPRLSTFTLCGSVVALGCDAGVPSTTEEPAPSYTDPSIVPEGEAPVLDEPDRVARDEVIGSFESGEFAFQLSDGRGYWSAPPDEELESGTDGADETAASLLASGGTALAHLSPEVLAAPVPKDISSCTGLSFYARGSGELTVALAGPGGALAATVTLGDEWTESSLSWEDFGAEVRDLDAIDTMTFSSETEPLELDEVVLEECELRMLNPPLPEPGALGEEAPEGSPVAVHGQLALDGVQIVDQLGEPVQLKGISSMWLNLGGDGFADNRTGLEWIRDEWGVEVFRAAVGGHLGQPKTSRERVGRVVDLALELGLYVIIDWHSHEAQDELPESRAFFADMAETYGESPNVIYEPFNEPLRDADWDTVLKPYHESVVATIRSIDPDNLIVLGTPQWSQLVQQAADNPIAANNILYTLHFYSCTHQAQFRGYGDYALSHGAPLFVTEWGGTPADGGSSSPIVCDEESRLWLDWMEDNGLSWAAWKFDACGDSSCLLRAGASPSGGWTEAQLNGHAPIVIEGLEQ